MYWVYVCVHTSLSLYIFVYIYICTEREREKKIVFCLSLPCFFSCPSPCCDPYLAGASTEGVRLPKTLRRPMQAALEDAEKQGSVILTTEIPAYWTVRNVGESHWVEASLEVTKAVQALMNKTWSGVRTCDRRNTSVVPTYEVVDVVRNENAALWRRYYWRRERLRVASTTSCFKRQEVQQQSIYSSS